jgi:hypothetical protein
MTVRITKSEINIREKLTELEGRSKEPVEIPTFRGDLNGNQNIPDSVYTLYDVKTAHWDNYNGFDPSDSSYTIPINGVYLITFMQWWNNKPEGRSIMRVYVNGSAVTSDYHLTNAGGTMSTTAQLALDAGDKVQMYIHQNSGSTQAIDANDLNNGLGITKIA